MAILFLVPYFRIFLFLYKTIDIYNRLQIHKNTKIKIKMAYKEDIESMDRTEENKTNREKENIEDMANKNEKSRKAITYIAAMFLIIIIVAMVVPVSYITPNPEPKATISYNNAIGNYSLKYISTKYTNKSHRYSYYESNIAKIGVFREFMNSSSPIIKQTSNKIASYGCKSEKICQAKAIFYFVRDKIDYIGEKDDYVQYDDETLLTKGGDCEDKAILLTSMLNAIGVPAQVIVVPKHAFVRAYINNAPKRYLQKDRWLLLDPSCNGCKFGKATKYDKNQYERIFLKKQ